MLKEHSVRRGDGQVQWECQCNCGNPNSFLATTRGLMKGSTKSCGCIKRELLVKRNKEVLTKHNMSSSRLYHIWDTMKARCYRESHKSYSDYGGRGIKVCDEWHTFEPFMKWALQNGYADHLTIDRKDVNSSYEPSNCRWITIKEQINNTRVNRKITLRGETKTLSEWADIIGISPKALRYRVESGWSEDDLFSQTNHGKQRVKKTKYRSNSIVIDIDGTSKSLSEWAGLIEVHYSTLKKRYDKGITGKELLISEKYKNIEDISILLKEISYSKENT